MSRSFSKDVEHAANSVIEALVRRMFEVHERLKQKESEFIQLHNDVVNEIENNIIKQYENQRFSIDEEKGLFEMKGLQNDKVIFVNDEKTVHVDLNKLDSLVKPEEGMDKDKRIWNIDDEGIGQEVKIETPKVTNEFEKEYDVSTAKRVWSINGEGIGEEVKIETPKIETENIEKGNEFIEIFKDKSNDEITKQIQEFQEYRNNFHESIFYSDDSNMKDREYKELEKIDEKLNNMKEAQKILETSKEKKDLPLNEHNLNKAKKLNVDASNKLEKNIENSIQNSNSPLLLPSQIRGQLEVLNHLKSMSEKEVLKSFKDAQKQARIEDKLVPEVYKENLQKYINERIQHSKERILDTAISTYEKNKELRNNLRSIENEINKNMGVLYQAKLEQKISPEEYKNLKENLEIQKTQINDRLLKINQSDQRINEQLKVDLKQQFPDMKTDKLTLNESIGLASAAYSMTNEKTIENLRNFSLENDLKGIINSIDKTTKEVEFEVEEITEIKISR